MPEDLIDGAIDGASAPAHMSPTLEALTVIAQREITYGPPAVFFRHLAQSWSAHLGHTVTPRQAAHLMVILKITRLAHDPDHWDSAVDAIGYLEIASRLGT